MDEYIDIVFDGAPGPHAPHFVEVEDVAGKSITMGFWTHRPDNFWALRIPNPARIATLESQLAALQRDNAALRDKMGRVAIGYARYCWLRDMGLPTEMEADFAAYLESEDYKKEMGDDYLSRNG